jgi:hypothetical protein
LISLPQPPSTPRVMPSVSGMTGRFREDGL